MLNGQRVRVMRSARRAVDRYKRIDKIPRGSRSESDKATLEEARAEMLARSAPSAEFSAAVRCLLIANGLRKLVVQDELKPLAMNSAEV